ncbi:hypothetical protein AOQ72_04200 [Bradyrhizobium yuanmingense]|uniref:Uncharacterized protein n=1 Tax=Bradyrhizobium yuanmingense TaxID=108015 RepID=A0A0R3BKC3_9BRAD|nr:hypothetical protein [Bradyrhizobium yuanmingense]KRP85848.1 hypothetical protein AOQ72_04200 [Bradyrhizobium yuanmingense]
MKHRRLAWALSLLLLLLAWENANARDTIDLRDLSLGMSVANIPPKEYINLACAAKEDVKLSSWNHFRACPADETGLHSISFRFNNEVNPLAAVNDKYEGTKLGGHPVLLRGLVDSSGALRGIRIDTDPSARLFWRKKAYLLALSVRARYGEAGWICRELESREDESPVAGLLIKERCEKRSERRHLILDRELYRRADQPISDFVNATHLIIEETTDR